jgi:hypothetical protein
MCGTCRRKDTSTVNPYTMLSSRLGTHDATSLSARLTAWHDAMVAHERRLRAGAKSDACDDECPHAEARVLWSEAVAVFGGRAEQLTFLSSRARDDRRAGRLTSPRAPSEEAAGIR